MKNIRPPRETVDLRTLKLSPEEGFVLSRVDSATSVKDLVALTGLDEGRVLEIVTRLAEQGAVELDGARAAAARPERTEATEVAAEVTDESAGEPTEDDGAQDTDELRQAEEADERQELSYRRIYETVYQPMDRDRRGAAAKEVAGPDLLALCLDPDPTMISAIADNPHYGAEHARMIALHHRTQIGLETIARRTDHLKDALVQRRLLRNPQLPGTILNRIVNPKMMMEVYKISIDRDIPERSRILTREVLRKKFMLASSDEKAALLAKTEGRCLLHLVNCSLDAHATQILCGKNAYSVLFIQNLARWSATPPTLLAHLLKMQTVRHNVGLRKMLLKHPNAPSDAKRNL